MPVENTTLQERFLISRGQPVVVGSREVAQIDHISFPGSAQVTILFVSEAPCKENAAVIAILKPGKIFLSDGTAVQAVKIWDDPTLPREVNHKVEAAGQLLKVYNKYRTRHAPDFVTEDNFTGNAGMIVTDLRPNQRLYECSSGPGEFSPADLVFEIAWNELAE